MEGALAESAVCNARPVADSAAVEAGSLEFSPGSVRLCLVPVEDVAAVAGEVGQWIEAAMRSAASGSEPMEKVMARLGSGEYRLMLAGIGDKVYAAAVLELTELQGRGCLFIVAAGGAVGRTFAAVGPDMWRGILVLGRALGVGVALKGRPGWARWCARHAGPGWRFRVSRILLEVS